jgi:hypothetical protein
MELKAVAVERDEAGIRGPRSVAQRRQASSDQFTIEIASKQCRLLNVEDDSVTQNRDLFFSVAPRSIELLPSFVLNRNVSTGNFGTLSLRFSKGSMVPLRSRGSVTSPLLRQAKYFHST